MVNYTKRTLIKESINIGEKQEQVKKKRSNCYVLCFIFCIERGSLYHYPIKIWLIANKSEKSGYIATQT